MKSGIEGKLKGGPSLKSIIILEFWRFPNKNFEVSPIVQQNNVLPLNPLYTIAYAHNYQ